MIKWPQILQKEYSLSKLYLLELRQQMKKKLKQSFNSKCGAWDTQTSKTPVFCLLYLIYPLMQMT